MDETTENGEWRDEEIDEMFQLHAQYAGTENMLGCIMDGLQENNIFKSKQEVAKFQNEIVSYKIQSPAN